MYSKLLGILRKIATFVFLRPIAFAMINKLTLQLAAKILNANKIKYVQVIS